MVNNVKTFYVLSQVVWDVKLCRLIIQNTKKKKKKKKKRREESSFLELSLCGQYAMYMNAVKYIGLSPVLLRQLFAWLEQSLSLLREALQAMASIFFVPIITQNLKKWLAFCTDEDNGV